MVTLLVIIAIAIVTPSIIVVQRKVEKALHTRRRELAHKDYLAQLERKMCNRLNAF